jgi:DNA-binding winged helix-turn-helix (wHTH) protein
VTQPVSSVVALGSLTLDLARGRLTGPDGDIALRAKSYALLCHMARNRGRVLSKDELMAAVWPDVTVTDESLTQCVHDVRRTLGDAGVLLRTIPRRGYVLDAAGADAAPTGPVPGSIAVMPFMLTGPDALPDQVLFDGLAHEVLSRLATLRAFHVIGRGTSFAVRHMADDPVGFGQLVRVAYLVTGRAVRRGAQFRLHVDLLDSADGHVVWSDAFEMDTNSVMLAAHLLANPIATAIAREVTAQERRIALRAAPDQPPDAWRTFHMGLNGILQPGGELALALDHFNTAIRLDPAFSRAHAFASFCHYNFAMRGAGPERQGYVKAANATASEALHLDEASPVAHWAYGRALWLRKDPAGALRHIRHAIDLCPSFPQAHYMAGFIEAHQGDAGRGIAHLTAFKALSPLDPFLASTQVAHATALARLGDSNAAASMALRAAGHQHEFDNLQCHAALILAGLGQLDQARVIMGRAPANEPVFNPQDLFQIIYDIPDDICHILQSGRRALNLPAPQR